MLNNNYYFIEIKKTSVSKQRKRHTISIDRGGGHLKECRQAGLLVGLGFTPAHRSTKLVFSFSLRAGVKPGALHQEPKAPLLLRKKGWRKAWCFGGLLGFATEAPAQLGAQKGERSTCFSPVRAPGLRHHKEPMEKSRPFLICGGWPLASHRFPGSRHSVFCWPLPLNRLSLGTNLRENQGERNATFQRTFIVPWANRGLQRSSLRLAIAGMPRKRICLNPPIARAPQGYGSGSGSANRRIAEKKIRAGSSPLSPTRRIRRENRKTPCFTSGSLGFGPIGPESTPFWLLAPKGQFGLAGALVAKPNKPPKLQAQQNTYIPSVDFQTNKQQSEVKLITIEIASSEKIRQWAEKTLPNGKILGQVLNANTLHHRTFKPQKGGLFCERIFGPLKDFECACGKSKKPSSPVSFSSPTALFSGGKRAAGRSQAGASVAYSPFSSSSFSDFWPAITEGQSLREKGEGEKGEKEKTKACALFPGGKMRKHQTKGVAEPEKDMHEPDMPNQEPSSTDQTEPVKPGKENWPFPLAGLEEGLGEGVNPSFSPLLNKAAARRTEDCLAQGSENKVKADEGFGLGMGKVRVGPSGTLPQPTSGVGKVLGNLKERPAAFVRRDKDPSPTQTERQAGLLVGHVLCPPDPRSAGIKTSHPPVISGQEFTQSTKQYPPVVRSPWDQPEARSGGSRNNQSSLLFLKKDPLLMPFLQVSSAGLVASQENEEFKITAFRRFDNNAKKTITSSRKLFKELEKYRFSMFSNQKNNSSFDKLESVLNPLGLQSLRQPEGGSSPMAPGLTGPCLPEGQPLAPCAEHEPLSPFALKDEEKRGSCSAQGAKEDEPPKHQALLVRSTKPEISRVGEGKVRDALKDSPDSTDKAGLARWASLPKHKAILHLSPSSHTPKIAQNRSSPSLSPFREKQGLIIEDSKNKDHGAAVLPFSDFRPAITEGQSLGEKGEKRKAEGSFKTQRPHAFPCPSVVRSPWDQPEKEYMGLPAAKQRLYCPDCDVEYTWSVIRRYQLGYISLIAPVAHVWYIKTRPNILSILLGMKAAQLENVVYCTKTFTLENTFFQQKNNIFSFFKTYKSRLISSYPVLNGVSPTKNKPESLILQLPLGPSPLSLPAGQSLSGKTKSSALRVWSYRTLPPGLYPDSYPLPYGAAKQGAADPCLVGPTGTLPPVVRSPWDQPEALCFAGPTGKARVARLYAGPDPGSESTARDSAINIADQRSIFNWPRFQTRLEKNEKRGEIQTKTEKKVLFYNHTTNFQEIKLNLNSFYFENRSKNNKKQLFVPWGKAPGLIERDFDPYAHEDRSPAPDPTAGFALVGVGEGKVGVGEGWGWFGLGKVGVRSLLERDQPKPTQKNFKRAPYLTPNSVKSPPTLPKPTQTQRYPTDQQLLPYPEPDAGSPNLSLGEEQNHEGKGLARACLCASVAKPNQEPPDEHKAQRIRTEGKSTQLIGDKKLVSGRKLARLNQIKNMYCISFTFTWETELEWQNFCYYFFAPIDFEDELFTIGHYLNPSLIKYRAKNKKYFSLLSSATWLQGYPAIGEEPVLRGSLACPYAKHQDEPPKGTNQTSSPEGEKGVARGGSCSAHAQEHMPLCDWACAEHEPPLGSPKEKTKHQAGLLVGLPHRSTKLVGSDPERIHHQRPKLLGLDKILKGSNSPTGRKDEGSGKGPSQPELEDQPKHEEKGIPFRASDWHNDWQGDLNVVVPFQLIGDQGSDVKVTLRRATNAILVKLASKLLNQKKNKLTLYNNWFKQDNFKLINILYPSFPSYSLTFIHFDLLYLNGIYCSFKPFDNSLVNIYYNIEERGQALRQPKGFLSYCLKETYLSLVPGGSSSGSYGVATAWHVLCASRTTSPAAPSGKSLQFLPLVSLKRSLPEGFGPPEAYPQAIKTGAPDIAKLTLILNALTRPFLKFNAWKAHASYTFLINNKSMIPVAVRPCSLVAQHESSKANFRNLDISSKVNLSVLNLRLFKKYRGARPLSLLSFSPREKKLLAQVLSERSGYWQRQALLVGHVLCPPDPRSAGIKTSHPPVISGQEFTQSTTPRDPEPNLNPKGYLKECFSSPHIWPEIRKSGGFGLVGVGEGKVRGPLKDSPDPTDTAGLARWAGLALVGPEGTLPPLFSKGEEVALWADIQPQALRALSSGQKLTLRDQEKDLHEGKGQKGGQEETPRSISVGYSKDNIPMSLCFGGKIPTDQTQPGATRRAHAFGPGEGEKFKNKVTLLNTKTFSITGAGLLKILLTDYNYSELQKMDQQYRILLADIQNAIEAVDNKKTLKLLVAKKERLFRRIKIIRKLKLGKNTIERLVLSVLPVLPPDLRPIVTLNSQIAASDLNRLYQKVLYRNERLKKFLKDPATRNSYEMKYAQRLLQESVDNLIENGKSGVVPERDARGRLFKSLTELLKGKQGRFRQYLLGKRVDYSGRSVIVVGPKLKIHECGLPIEMAVELFLPFLIKRILTTKLANNVYGAKQLIKTNKSLTCELLQDIMHPVLLNRAPTLHRLGIQAFQPKLITGRAILLHPLVCPSFNADFDGDQMAVHVPITSEARTEAWKLMLSRNNILSPASGDALLLPSQDMVLGCYYLTTQNFKYQKGSGYIFTSFNDVLKAYERKLLDVHANIWVKWSFPVSPRRKEYPNLSPDPFGLGAFPHASHKERYAGSGLVGVGEGKVEGSLQDSPKPTQTLPLPYPHQPQPGGLIIGQKISPKGIGAASAWPYASVVLRGRGGAGQTKMQSIRPPEGQPKAPPYALSSGSGGVWAFGKILQDQTTRRASEGKVGDTLKDSPDPTDKAGLARPLFSSSPLLSRKKEKGEEEDMGGSSPFSFFLERRGEEEKSRCSGGKIPTDQTQPGAHMPSFSPEENKPPKHKAQPSPFSSSSRLYASQMAPDATNTIHVVNNESETNALVFKKRKKNKSTWETQKQCGLCSPIGPPLREVTPTASHKPSALIGFSPKGWRSQRKQPLSLGSLHPYFEPDPAPDASAGVKPGASFSPFPSGRRSQDSSSSFSLPLGQSLREEGLASPGPKDMGGSGGAHTSPVLRGSGPKGTNQTSSPKKEKGLLFSGGQVPRGPTNGEEPVLRTSSPEKENKEPKPRRTAFLLSGHVRRTSHPFSLREKEKRRRAEHLHINKGPTYTASSENKSNYNYLKTDNNRWGEIRVTKFGFWLHISHFSQRRFDPNGFQISQLIRTTPGRVFLNLVINKIITD